MTHVEIIAISPDGKRRSARPDGPSPRVRDARNRTGKNGQVLAVAFACTLTLLDCTSRLSSATAQVDPPPDTNATAPDAPDSNIDSKMTGGSTIRRDDHEVRKPDFGDFKPAHSIDQLTGEEFKYFSSWGGTTTSPHSVELLIFCSGGSTMAALGFPRVMYGSYVLRWKSDAGKADSHFVNPDKASRYLKFASDYKSGYASSFERFTFFDLLHEAAAIKEPVRWGSVAVIGVTKS